MGRQRRRALLPQCFAVDARKTYKRALPTLNISLSDRTMWPRCLFASFGYPTYPYWPLASACFAATAILVYSGGGTCFAFVSDTPPASWAFRFEGLPNISVSYCPIPPNGRIVLRCLRPCAWHFLHLEIKANSKILKI